MENENLAVMLRCVQAPIITENLMDVGAQLQAKLDVIRAFPKDQEHAAKVKKLRAECNKAFKEAEEGRKAVKQACLAPYEKAMKLYDGFVKNPFGSFDKECKDFIDEVENKEKAECEEQLKEYFAELCGMKGIHWLKWERMGIKIDLATARQETPRKAMEAIKSKVDKICADLDVITHRENSPEILAEYERCLDLTEAIGIVDARKKAAERAAEAKAKWEAMREQAAQLRQTVAAEVPVVASVKSESEKKFRVTFTITATLPMLRGLKAFLESKNYEYQEVPADGAEECNPQ